MYRFWLLTDEQQESFFTKGQADLLRKTYNTHKEELSALSSKVQFSREYADFTGRTIVPTEELTLEMFREKFLPAGKALYKPNSSSLGNGIRVFTLKEGNLKYAFNIIMNKGPGVVEEFVVQHPEMQKLSKRSVNTIRVVTIRTDNPDHGIETEKVHFLYAGVRMGAGNRYLDNLHKGGMIAGLNLETGIIETNGVNFANKENITHPNTGTVIKGFKVPMWQEAMELVEKAAQRIYGYIGWDIAITVNGPVIIEANTHPGAGVLQNPYVPEQKGMKHVIEPYLPKKD